MQQRHLTSMFVLTGSLLGGCLVQLPGNLDAGDSSSGDTDSGDGDSAESGDGDSGDGDSGDGDGDGDGDSGDGDSGDGDSGDGDGDGDPGPIDGDGCQTALDVLLILDNSGSMGEEQALLASGLIEPLLAPLDDSGVDWRLAVTTTDVGNPWCPPASTTPEAGAFQFRSCNEHLEDFVFNGVIDVTDVACNSLCPYAPGKLHTLPSTTAEDPEAKPRPWIERIGGVSNLPIDVDPVSAALCIVPQGVNGCGFEQPLEALDRALERQQSVAYPEHGFLRLDASLLVIFVTDEEDCSYADDSIFLPEGAKTFWSDPNASFPTSAVCWNAGTSCIGDPSDYDDCVSANYDELGNPAAAEDAVLKPVAGYMSTLLNIEQEKRALDPGADVSVLVISGLGLDGQLHYADVNQSDPEFQDSYGIGPGCTADVPEASPVTAIPPVRLREVGAALTSEPLASICAPSFVDSLAGTYQQLFGSCE